MDVLILLLLIVTLFIAFDAAAFYLGVDSRDGIGDDRIRRGPQA